MVEQSKEGVHPFLCHYKRKGVVKPDEKEIVIGISRLDAAQGFVTIRLPIDDRDYTVVVVPFVDWSENRQTVSEFSWLEIQSYSIS